MRTPQKNNTGKLRFPLRVKFFLVLSALVGLISIFIYFYFPFKLERQALKSIADKAQSIIKMTAFSVSSPLVFEDKKDIETVLAGVKQNQDLAYLIVQDQRGKVFSAYNLPLALENDYRFEVVLNPISSNRSVYRTASPILHNERQIGEIFLGISLAGLRNQIDRSQETIAQISAIVFILGLAIVFFISAVVTRPLNKMVRTIDEISRGDLSRRVAFSSQDEVGNLAQAFNTMVENLEEAYRKMAEWNKSLEEMVKERTHELEVEITERKEAQKVLAEEKERLAVTLGSIGEGVITTDTNGRLVMMNKVAETLTGWKLTESIGESVSRIFCLIDKKAKSTDSHPVKKVMETGKIMGISGETVLIDRDGNELVVSANAAPIYDKTNTIIGSILVFRDITNEKRTEKELLKIQKLESLGLLAGGIAHDFNNIMTAILGNVDLVRLTFPPNSHSYKRLQAAESAVMRAQSLTRQLLTFSRGGAPVKALNSIADIVKETVNFTLSGSKTDCRVSIADNLGIVDCDKDQVSLVINNILLNAQQAMPRGGMIEVKAENVAIKGGNIHLFNPGEYVKISIKDTGIGIEEEKLAKIFDPYFTTKPEGSGLGLSTSYSIIKKHDGDILVESELGKGSTFYIYLPIAEGTAEVDNGEMEKVKPGKGRVLVMDDQDIVLKTAGEMLLYLGYETIYAHDGTEAIDLFKRAGEAGRPFTLLIFDLTVPGGMGGREAIEKIRALDPGVKAVVSTGYSTENITIDFQALGFCAILNKPYLVQELSAVLNRVLDTKPGEKTGS